MKSIHVQLKGKEGIVNIPLHAIEIKDGADTYTIESLILEVNKLKEDLVTLRDIKDTEIRELNNKVNRLDRIQTEFIRDIQALFPGGNK